MQNKKAKKKRDPEALKRKKQIKTLNEDVERYRKFYVTTLEELKILQVKYGNTLEGQNEQLRGEIDSLNQALEDEQDAHSTLEWEHRELTRKHREDC